MDPRYSNDFNVPTGRARSSGGVLAIQGGILLTMPWRMKRKMRYRRFRCHENEGKYMKIPRKYLELE